MGAYETRREFDELILAVDNIVEVCLAHGEPDRIAYLVARHLRSNLWTPPA